MVKRYWTSFVNDPETCPPLVEGTLAVCVAGDVAALEARCRELEGLLRRARPLCNEQGVGGIGWDIDHAFPAETGAERVCSHPIEEYNHHGFVSGNPNDYRCTICNTVVNFSPLQIAAWHDLRSTANRGAEHG